MTIDLSAMKNNREKAIALINDGNATKQALMGALGINDKSLASVFAQLRLMGNYPIKNEDGTFRLGTEADYLAAKPEPKEKKEVVKKTKAELVAAAQKRETKAASAATNAKTKFEADGSRKNELRMIIADAELELASILLGEAESLPDDDELVSGVPTNEAVDIL